MTEKRKQQIVDAALEYLRELIHEDEEIFSVFHDRFGMSQEELHESGIDYLDDFFSESNPQEELREKIERCYRDYEDKWLHCTPEQIVNICEEVYAVTLTYNVITREGVPHDAAPWLIRFKDPLQVISDAWRYANDMDTVLCEAQFDRLIDDLYDKRDAENEYSLEDGHVSDPS